MKRLQVMSEIKPPKVTVLNIKRIENAGNLKAIVDIKIGPLEIYKCRVVQQPNQSAWVSPPQEMYERGGKKSYYPLLKWPREWNDAINQAVGMAYEEA